MFCNGFKIIITSKNEIDVYLDTLQNSEPFYSASAQIDFYDAPLWKYSVNNWRNLFKPNISSWQARTYLFKLEESSNSLICLGGVGWGFKFAWYCPYPIAIHPFSLCKNLWQTDKQILKDFFRDKGYVLNLQ